MKKIIKAMISVFIISTIITGTSYAETYNHRLLYVPRYNILNLIIPTYNKTKLPEMEEVKLSKASEYDGYAVPDSETLNVYSDKNKDSNIVGKIYTNTKAYVIDRQKGWTKICSGNVVGYVEEKALAYDSSAEKLIKKVASSHAEVKSLTQLYKKSDIDKPAGIEVKTGTTLQIVDKYNSWTKVLYSEKEYYIPNSEINVIYDLRDGMTTEEINSIKVTQVVNQGKIYNSNLNIKDGIYEFAGRKETYYSSNVLYHINTPNWILDDEGFYHDPITGAYVVAASDLPQGTVFTGSKGMCIVLDSGCNPGITDYYVNW